MIAPIHTVPATRIDRPSTTGAGAELSSALARIPQREHEDECGRRDHAERDPVFLDVEPARGLRGFAHRLRGRRDLGRRVALARGDLLELVLVGGALGDDRAGILEIGRAHLDLVGRVHDVAGDERADVEDERDDRESAHRAMAAVVAAQVATHPQHEVRRGTDRGDAEHGVEDEQPARGGFGEHG